MARHKRRSRNSEPPSTPPLTPTQKKFDKYIDIILRWRAKISTSGASPLRPKAEHFVGNSIRANGLTMSHDGSRGGNPAGIATAEALETQNDRIAALEAIVQRLTEDKYIAEARRERTNDVVKGEVEKHWAHLNPDQPKTCTYYRRVKIRNCASHEFNFLTVLRACHDDAELRQDRDSVLVDIFGYSPISMESLCSYSNVVTLLNIRADLRTAYWRNRVPELDDERFYKAVDQLIRELLSLADKRSAVKHGGPYFDSVSNLSQWGNKLLRSQQPEGGEYAT